jgi:hypothetical protein
MGLNQSILIKRISKYLNRQFAKIPQIHFPELQKHININSDHNADIVVTVASCLGTLSERTPSLIPTLGVLVLFERSTFRECAVGEQALELGPDCLSPGGEAANGMGELRRSRRSAAS